MKPSTIKYNDVLFSIFGLLLFLLSVFPHFVTIGIILLVGAIIYGYVKRKITFQFNKITALFVLLYLIYVVGVFFSDDQSIALKYLEYKLSLLAFPLLLMIRIHEPFSYKNAFIGLILGCIVGAGIGLYKGMFCYAGTGDFNCLLSSSVSTVIHPTYFSVYTTIAIIAVWVGYQRKYRFFSLITCLLVTLFLILYTVFMMSLTGMLFLGLMIFGTIAGLIYVKWKWYGLVAFVIAAPALLFLSYKFIPQVKHEVDDVIYYGERYLQNSDHYFESLYYPYSGTESRLIMWRVSMEQLKETPWGLGTGNVDHTLQERMTGQLHEEFVERNLNSHNQYLQTGLEIGLIGLLILIVPILLLFVKSIKEKNLLLFALVLSFAFNCLFESMLQRQSGVVFYVLLFCIMTVPYSFKNQNE